jgi:GMP synthase (glutamine-hydrolysing)
VTQDIHRHRLLILDFGSQYTQLIARRIREVGVYCEIIPWDSIDDDDSQSFEPSGIILSGGPESVTRLRFTRAPEVVFNLDVPILGICYGMQTMAAQLGGAVEGSDTSEFGYAQIRRTTAEVFAELDRRTHEGTAAA